MMLLVGRLLRLCTCINTKKPNGKGKLSKRDGDKDGYPVFPIKWDSLTTGFRESGFLSKAVVNYLALLGWNNSDEREIFSLSELINCFNSTGIQKGGRDLIMKKQNGLIVNI